MLSRQSIPSNKKAHCTQLNLNRTISKIFKILRTIWRDISQRCSILNVINKLSLSFNNFELLTPAYWKKLPAY